ANDPAVDPVNIAVHALLNTSPYAVQFGMAAPDQAVAAGQASSITVTALSKAAKRSSRYQGAVHFSSTDGRAGLPRDYTFTAGDKGVHTFGVVPKTPGRQTVKVADKTHRSVSGAATLLVSNVQVLGIAPASGPPRGTVTITGQGFSPHGTTI